MRSLLRPVGRRYEDWLTGWENHLCFRSTDRVVRPFEYGLEWSRRWPMVEECKADPEDAHQFILEMNELAIARPEEFFAYQRPASFTLGTDNWLEFQSPVETPFPENNRVRGLWHPAKGNSKKAVVVLPHWNSKLPQHNALAAGIAKLGISALRLSLPYHDDRTPSGLARADYAMSSNICRTIDATRQAVIDTRACFDWLEEQGFTSLGLVGTSIGSCYAFLATALDARVGVNVFNHCSTYVADVVWEGLSTRHIRSSLDGKVSLDDLRQYWMCISPPSYYDLYSAKKKRSKFIYTKYDTTFPVKLSEQVIEGARERKWDHSVRILPCGHYTMGESPFKFMTGFEICSFLKKHL